MTLHLQERPDLAYGEVFPIPERNQLIESADELIRISKNLPLVEASAGAGHDLGEQVQRIDVLQNVGLLVGDKHHVQLIQRLVNESDIVLLNGRMLCARIRRLGEGCQEGFDARPLDVVECPREHGLAATGADGRSKDDLVIFVRISQKLRKVKPAYHLD